MYVHLFNCEIFIGQYKFSKPLEMFLDEIAQVLGPIWNLSQAITSFLAISMSTSTCIVE